MRDRILGIGYVIMKFLFSNRSSYRSRFMLVAAGVGLVAAGLAAGWILAYKKLTPELTQAQQNTEQSAR